VNAEAPIVAVILEKLHPTVHVPNPIKMKSLVNPTPLTRRRIQTPVLVLACFLLRCC
jgi:hypothetical protein